MALPPLPQLTAEADADTKALWLWCSRLSRDLEDFTPSQVAAALNLGGLGTGPGSPADSITLPVVQPTPATPVMDPPVGFYRQIVVSWSIDVNPFITGWEVQRADNLAFTTNVTTRTSAFALMFVDEGLPDSTTRYYRLRARTKDPAVSSPFCAPQAATTLANDTGVLTSLQTAAVLIQRAHIHNLVVDTAKIADASILTAKIADAQITTAKIVDLAVSNAKIDNLSVTTAKIASLAVTNAKVNDVAADKLTAGTINVLVQLTNQTIKLDGVNSQITITDTQGAPVVRIKLGKLSSGSTDYGLICYDSSGQVMFDSTNQGATQFGIKDLEVITGKLNDLAVTTGKIAANAVSQLLTVTSSDAAYSNSTTTFSDVTSRAITTAGGQVELNGSVTIGIFNDGAAAKNSTAIYRVVRDTTTLRQWSALFYLPKSTDPGHFLLCPMPLNFMDAPSAGSYTYRITAAAGEADTTMTAGSYSFDLLEFKK